MSAVVAVLQRDGAPVDLEAGAIVVDALGHHGPDGRRTVELGWAMLSHLHLLTTPEEVGEDQPARSDDARVHVAFDGRLDNRDELTRRLGLEPTEAREATDAQLVLAAYLRWGAPDCFATLLGPFAVAIADGLDRRLILARDPTGGRGLYFHLSSQIAVAATEESAVAAHPAVGSELDRHRLALHFAIDALPVRGTFFRRVETVLPGTAVLIDQTRATRSTFWRPDLTPLRNRPDREHAERVREVFDQAVRCRLRSITPPAVMMSGGLDSTSIAAVAAPALAEAGHPGRLRTYSYVFDELRECDERPYIDQVVARHGLDPVMLPGDDCWPLKDLATWPVNRNSPSSDIFARLPLLVYNAARDDRRRTLLSGMFGDHLFRGGREAALDRLREGQAVRAARMVLAHARNEGIRASLTPFLRQVPGLRGARRRLRRPPEWLTDEAAALWREARAEDPEAWLPKAVRPQQALSLLGYDPVHGTPNAANLVSRFGLDLRYPYRDLRLLELMLRLPAHRLIAKNVLRDAMLTTLPEPVRLRAAKTHFGPVLRRGLEDREAETANDILWRPHRRWSRWVREAWIRAGSPRVREQRHIRVKWRCIAFELW